MIPQEIREAFKGRNIVEVDIQFTEKPEGDPVVAAGCQAFMAVQFNTMVRMYEPMIGLDRALLVAATVAEGLAEKAWGHKLKIKARHETRSNSEAV